jgi:four helix bundle protein
VGTVNRFEDLGCWQKARELCRVVYRLTNEASFRRDFKLRDQIRDASVSVMSNIAEGFERDGNREFLQFLGIAKGSAGEVRSQLYVALDAGHISEKQFREVTGLAIEVPRMLRAFMRYLNQCDVRGDKYRSESLGRLS